MNKIKNRLIKKASTSVCNYKISAVALDKRGKVLGYTTNKLRMSLDSSMYGRGIHAELDLIHRYSDNISTIIICRVGRSGEIRPISPCERCSRVASKLGIKIISIDSN